MQMVTCILNVTTTVDDDTLFTYNSLPDKLQMGYIFTVVIYALLRIVEYVVLGAATLKFVAKKELISEDIHAYL